MKINIAVSDDKNRHPKRLGGLFLVLCLLVGLCAGIVLCMQGYHWFFQQLDPGSHLPSFNEWIKALRDEDQSYRYIGAIMSLFILITLIVLLFAPIVTMPFVGAGVVKVAQAGKRRLDARRAKIALEANLAQQSHQILLRAGEAPSTPSDVLLRSSLSDQEGNPKQLLRMAEE